MIRLPLQRQLSLLLGCVFAGLFAPLGLALADNWDNRFTPPLDADGEVHAIAVQGNQVYIGGTFSTVGGVEAYGIAKWNGTTWEPLGDGVDGVVNAIAISGNNVYVGGSFGAAGDVDAANIAVWNGTNWLALASGLTSDQTQATVQSIVTNGSSIFVGGIFDTAGDVGVTNIARWSGSTWSALGNGIHYIPADTNDTASPIVSALAMSGSTLYVGGFFNQAGTIGATNIARWSGSTWSTVGSGLDYVPLVSSSDTPASVSALAVSGTNLYAGGFFNTASNVDVENIAVWNGTRWSAVGGPTDAAVRSIFATSNSVYIGGEFSSVDNLEANGVARWNGTNWQSFGDGVEDGPVQALALIGSDLFVGGSFETVDGNLINNLAKWNNVNWSAAANGVANVPLGYPSTLLVVGTNVYVGGSFNGASTAAATNLAIWNGSAWTNVDTGVDGPVAALASDGTNLYVGGFFERAGNIAASNVVIWTGSAWQAFGEGLDGTVQTILLVGTNIYIGGNFVHAGTNSVNFVAHWSGTNWQQVGSGFDGPVFAMAALGTNIFAGGSFSSSGAIGITNLARWDGTQWQQAGGGVDGVVYALSVAGSKLYVGGSFENVDTNNFPHLATWDGTAWGSVGGGVNETVYSIAVSGTNVFVAGAFDTVGGSVAALNIAKWNGNIWTPLGDGLDYAAQGVVTDGRNVYVAGAFENAGDAPSYHFARWDDALPYIWQQPDPLQQIVSVGANFTLSVTVLGSGPITYQWQRNGANLPGETNNFLSRTNFSAAAVGDYRVIVSNAFGTATSMEAAVLLDSVTVFADDFESGSLANWTTVSGATALTVSTNQSHSGSRSALCSISTAKMFHNLGLELEGHARATFWIYDNNGTQNRWFGETRAYSGSGFGSGALKQLLGIGRYDTAFPTNNTGSLAGETVVSTAYQGQLFSGTNTGYFNLNQSPTPNRTNGWHKFQVERFYDGTTIGFFVDDDIRRELTDATIANWDSVTMGSVGSNSVSGNVWFDDIRVEYLDPPNIIVQPVSITTNAGKTITLSVTATGNVQNYQWRFNDANISGATTSALTLTNVQPGAAGAYTVAVGNGIGVTMSDEADLQVYTAPIISLQPQSATVCAGANLALQVFASGIPSALSYQWRLRGTNIPGATVSELILLDVATNQTGSYTVVITNVAGAITSAVANITITNSKPVILIPPQSQTANFAANATFSVLASGTAPRSYQWRFNSTNIASATTSVLRKTNLKATDVGSYVVVVSNSFGSATSATATLDLNYPPTIVTQPAGQTVSYGTNVTLNVVATGTEPLNYQWYLNGNEIPGEMDTALSLDDVQSSDAGSYSVLVYNVAGHVMSSNAVLVVNGPPSILDQPQDQSVSQGTNATFLIRAVGSGTLTYQWRQDGTNIPGATTSSLTRTNVQSRTTGLYSVLVANPYGSTLSDDAILSLDAYLVLSDGFELGSLTNWTKVPGATNLINSTAQKHSGTNSALCNKSLARMYRTLPVEVETHSRATFWIYDDLGTQNRWFGEVRAYDQTFGDTLDQLLAIGRYSVAFTTNQSGDFLTETVDTNYYQAFIADGGSTGFFNLNQFGAPTRSVGWHKFEIERSADSSLTFAVDGTVAREVFDATDQTWDSVTIGSTGDGATNGSVWFDDVKVEYFDLPEIIYPPSDELVSPGDTAAFSVVATGNVQSYQWRLNGTNISGATSSDLIINNVQTNDAGFYSVEVRNGIGPALSSEAVLTVVVAPMILLNPFDQSLLRGQSAQFSVEAIGQKPLYYQWRFNGTNISGATDSLYVRTNVTYANAGNYSVLVQNTAGSTSSSNALLEVRAPQPATFATAAVSSNQLTLQISGEMNGTYSIQTSTNLINWIEITNVVFGDTSFQFSLPITGGQQFYRAIGQ